MATITTSQTELNTPLELFYGWEQSQAHKPYLHQPINGEWHTWTWGEFGEQVRRMASALEAKGYAPGSKIAIMSRNCAHWIMADLAIMLSGHTSVPIYPNVNADTVSYILDHSEAKLMFVGKLEAHDWAEMQKGIPDSVSCISFGMYNLPDDSYPSWAEIVADHEPKSDSPARSLDDTMTIIYTSGTTGRPKGVVHKFLAPIFAFETFQKIFDLNHEDRFFSYLPLSHIAERMLITMGTLRCGGSVHFAQSLDTFAENLRTCSPTVFLGVPRIWTKFQMGVLAKFPPSRLNLLLAIPFLGGFIRKKIQAALGLSETKICLTGAAPMPVSTLKWYEKIGLKIYEVYGMTENAAYSHSNLPGKQKPGTVGVAMPGVEVKITDEGEICVKSLANMVEYYKDPEKTAQTIRDGFLHTGDKGVVDQEGFYRITGRVKDIFKTAKGKYVAPSPIELKLAENEFIEQSCVVGTGIPQPIALVVLSEEGRSRDRTEMEESLRETLKSVNPRLEHHEHLKCLVVMSEDWTVENGILTPSLKIKRGEIDDRFQKHYETWYQKPGVMWA